MSDSLLTELLEIRAQLKTLSNCVESIVASMVEPVDEISDQGAESCAEGEQCKTDKLNTQSLFMPDDSCLQDFQARELVRWIFPTAIREGRLSEEDVKFLRLWDSGTYFQGAPVPILFPYDENFSDISTVKAYRVWYCKDISIEYGGSKYRLLENPFPNRCVPVILNWFLQRGFTRDELIKRYAGRLAMAEATSEANADLFPHLKPGMRNILGAPRWMAKQGELPLRQDCSAEMMSKVLRPDGSVAASDVKNVLNRQLKKHGYTPSNFAAGTGIEWRFVKSWLHGELLIRANELEKIYKFLGIDNLFQGV